MRGLLDVNIEQMRAGMAWWYLPSPGNTPTQVQARVRSAMGWRIRSAGPIEIAAITKHEGFKWIERRHFYPPELNPAG
jgi:hypothetical protein